MEPKQLIPDNQIADTSNECLLNTMETESIDRQKNVKYKKFSTLTLCF